MKTSNEIEWEENANYAMVNKLSGKVYQSNEMPRNKEGMNGVVVFEGCLYDAKAFNLVERDSGVDEMEAARQKQREEYCVKYDLPMRVVYKMQNNRDLAEIILPLKAKDNA